MPKEQKAHTLTFSRKNQDVKKIINDKLKDENFILTDYICEAIRFFEKNEKNKVNNFDIETIINLIDSRLEQKIGENCITISNTEENEKISLKDELESDLPFNCLEDD